MQLDNFLTLRNNSAVADFSFLKLVQFTSVSGVIGGYFVVIFPLYVFIEKNHSVHLVDCISNAWIRFSTFWYLQYSRQLGIFQIIWESTGFILSF